jgi:hypothetical protein
MKARGKMRFHGTIGLFFRFKNYGANTAIDGGSRSKLWVSSCCFIDISAFLVFVDTRQPMCFDAVIDDASHVTFTSPWNNFPDDEDTSPVESKRRPL